MKGVRLSLFLFMLLIIVSLSSISALSTTWSTRHSIKFILGGENLGLLKNEFTQVALAPAPGTDAPAGTLVLAANRTNRPDILRHFHIYRGGWDIANRHYWASVGFTGVAGFILAFLWFILFGLALMIHLCCGWGINIKGDGSNHSQRICLTLLLLFTFAAASGCIILSVGQDKLHGEAVNTLHYVVNQSDYTVKTLRNVTEYLSLAKTINVAQMLLPSDIMDDIDNLNRELNTAADTLSEKTDDNAAKISKVFNAVRLALIVVSAVMLLLALIGLVLSILGYQHAILIFVISGWLLVATTFILCGVFMILNNAISDTCMAMGEWVENPHAESALSNILPCVDQRTTNKTLFQSKQVVTNIASVVNTFIYNTADANPTQGSMNYYNQSGPAMPPLCYPFDSQFRERQCTAQEVSSANASSVWKKYECEVSEYGICSSIGRVTPEIYMELEAAVIASYALEHYTPPLLSLQNCNFITEQNRREENPFASAMESPLHSFLLISLTLSLVSANSEGDALYTLKRTLSDPFNVLQSWDPTLVSPCTWFHVTCNHLNRVTRLDLGNSNLSGHLVPELAKLEHLQYLELYKNNIHGVIPPELGNLKNLISLDLYNNNISGIVPPSLGNLKNLVFLRLNDNRLTGPIPKELAGLPNLKVVDVSSNDLCGTIPTSGPFEHIPWNNFENNPRLEGPELLGLVRYDTNCS